MKLMEILVFEIKNKELSAFAESFKGHHIKFYEDPLNEKNIDSVKNCDIISVFIYSKISKEILEKMPNLKLIATRSTGFDHIDLEECRKRGIKVCNVPSYGDNTVAEHTFSLILALSRRIVEGKKIDMGKISDLEELNCFDLKDKTLGVIGAGKIGAKVIQIAKGFDMKVLAYDVYHNKDLAEKSGFEYAELDRLLSESDVITLHTPLFKENYHIIDSEALKKMKKEVLIINTARGGLIDTDALIEAIKKGIVAGAGLDVVENEELLKEDKSNIEIERIRKQHDYLASNKNVILTPHMAFYSRESVKRIINTTIENIQSFLNNQSKNVVT